MDTQSIGTMQARLAELEDEAQNLERRRKSVSASGVQPYEAGKLVTRIRDTQIEAAKVRTALDHAQRTGAASLISAGFARNQEAEQRRIDEAAASVAAQPLGPKEALLKRYEEVGITGASLRIARVDAGMERAERERLAREGAAAG